MNFVITVFDFVRGAVTWCIASWVHLGIVLAFVTVVVALAVNAFRENAARKAAEAAEKARRQAEERAKREAKEKALRERQAQEARELPARIKRQYEQLCYTIEDAERDFLKADRQVGEYADLAGKLYDQKEHVRFWETIEEGLIQFNNMAKAHREGQAATTRVKELLSAHRDILVGREEVKYDTRKDIYFLASAHSLYPLIRKGQIMDGFSNIFMGRQEYRCNTGIEGILNRVTNLAKWPCRE